MPEITITINTDNAAFADNPFELTDLIRNVVSRIDQIDIYSHDTELEIIDVNGNTVGILVIENKESK